MVRQLERERERLHIEYLPAYAPELNPDEGVWSQMKCLLANGRPDVPRQLHPGLASTRLEVFPLLFPLTH